jgi:hypothetical protein
MNFSDLPPELVSQMPLVAVLLWIGIQSRRELLGAIAKLTDRIDQVRLEVHALRLQLSGARPVPPATPGNGEDPTLMSGEWRE